MITSSNTVLSTLTVAFSLYSARFIVGEIRDTYVSILDEAAAKKHLNQNESAGNYSTESIAKVTTSRSLHNSPITKSHSFWNNVVPIYDMMKNQAAAKKAVITQNSTDSKIGGWIYKEPNLVTRSGHEYSVNHDVKPIENDENVYLKKVSNYDYRTSDSRQDYEEELDTYNSISDSSYPDNYYTDVEIPATNPVGPYTIWRGPPIHYQLPETKMCPCRQVQVRQQPPFNCPPGTTTFFNTLWMLGLNIWSLFQFLVTATIPFIIPLLFLKITIFVLKVYKFFKTIKFLLKLFILLPFLIRVVLPAITNLLNQQSVVHLLKVRHSENMAENRFWQMDNFLNSSELRSCAIKSACEFGVFIASTSAGHFPEKISKYLEVKANEVEKMDKVQDEMVDMEVYRIFIIALGRKWSQEQCNGFLCNITL